MCVSANKRVWLHLILYVIEQPWPFSFAYDMKCQDSPAHGHAVFMPKALQCLDRWGFDSLIKLSIDLQDLGMTLWKPAVA